MAAISLEKKRLMVPFPANKIRPHLGHVPKLILLYKFYSVLHGGNLWVTSESSASNSMAIVAKPVANKESLLWWFVVQW